MHVPCVWQALRLLHLNCFSCTHAMGLSTRVLKPDSLDPNPRYGFNVILCKPHMARIALMDMDLTHCHAAQHTAQIWIEAVWRESGLRIQIPDQHRIRIRGPVCRAPISIHNISRSTNLVTIKCLSNLVLNFKNMFSKQARFTPSSNHNYIILLSWCHIATPFFNSVNI